MNPLIMFRCFLAILTLSFCSVGGSSAVGQDRVGETVCNLETGEAPIVSLEWLEQPGTGKIAVLQQPYVTLVAYNHSRDWQRVHIRLNRFGNVKRQRSKPRWLWLPPHDKRLIRYNLTSLGFRPLQLRTSASIRAHVEVTDPKTTLLKPVTLDQSLSPKLYFHAEQSVRGKPWNLFVYDDIAKIEQFNSGDIRGAFIDDIRRDLAEISRPDYPTTLAAVIDAQDGSRRPDDVLSGGAGNGNLNFCVRIPFNTQDSDVGEDFYNAQGMQWVPASYARVDITNFNQGASSVVVDDGRLDVDGCISFDHTPNSDIWGVIILSQADVPRTDRPTDHNRFVALHSSGNVSTWYWYGELGTLDTAKYFYLDGDSRSNIFAAGVFSLMRFSDGLAGETIYAMDGQCPSASDNSCNSTFVNVEHEILPVVYIHPDHNDHKFAISHEIGHAVVHRFMGGVHPVLSSMYALNTGGPACIFQNGNAHALHSQEWSSSALTEGFAQFYATSVWNDTQEPDGAFHYYKDDYKNGTVQNVDMADGPVGGDDAYLRNVCPGDEISKLGRGVELDWSRQFWDYRTLPGVAPTNLELLEQYRLAVNPPGFVGWSNTNSWERMFDGIAQFDSDNGTDNLQRWDATDELNGIDF